MDGRWRGAAALLVTLAATVAACGENEPGDPVAPARTLAAPAPPDTHVDVGCVNVSGPSGHLDPWQGCSINLKLATSTSRAVATAWLVRTGQRIATTIHRPFGYRERRFRWDGVGAELPDGRSLDWFCRGSLRPIWHIDGLTDLRSFAPPAPGWFTSAAAASTAGCELAPIMCFPTGCYRQPEDPAAPRVTSERP